MSIRIRMTIVSIGMTFVCIALLASAGPASAAESRAFTVSVSRHAKTRPLSDEQVRKILAEASMILKKKDSAEDVACGITFTLSGHVGRFDSPTLGTDGFVRRDDLDAVHRVDESTDADLHVKVVVGIKEFCRFEGNNFIGCAYPPNFRSIIVFQPPEDLDVLGEPPTARAVAYYILWAHEFGHLMGLGHSEERNAVMSICGLAPDQKVVTRHECNCYLSGPGFGPNGMCDLRGPVKSVRCSPN